MVTVRNMKAEDAEASAKVVRETMEDTWNRLERDYYPRKALEFDMSLCIPEKYTKELQEPNNFHFVAEENGKIVGIATGIIQRGDEKAGGLARLGWICVHQSHQQKGIGEALLNHVIEYCRQQKCHKITLYTLPVLVPALKLYLKVGFVPEAYLRKEWWEIDFIKMSKWL
jgi:ribosomal protein S18 acetylase RimI-like enzyme